MRNYIVKVYREDGSVYDEWCTVSPISALVDLSARSSSWRGLGFKNATCSHTDGDVQWELVIKP